MQHCMHSVPIDHGRISELLVVSVVMNKATLSGCRFSCEHVFVSLE